MHDSPSSQALPVETKLFGELIETMADPPARSGIAYEFLPPVAK